MFNAAIRETPSSNEGCKNNFSSYFLFKFFFKHLKVWQLLKPGVSPWSVWSSSTSSPTASSLFNSTWRRTRGVGSSNSPCFSFLLLSQFSSYSRSLLLCKYLLGKTYSCCYPNISEKKNAHKQLELVYYETLNMTKQYFESQIRIIAKIAKRPYLQASQVPGGLICPGLSQSILVYPSMSCWSGFLLLF